MFEKDAEEKYCKGCKLRIEQCLWAWRHTNGLNEPNEKNCSCKEVPAYIAGAESREKRIEELEMTVGTLRTFSNEQAICIERLEKENRAKKENKNYVVYVKKLFFLKHGIKKISVSRYKYKTLPGARRRCKLMNSRQDVIECYIN